ncbi:MAG: alpha-mannosidase [Armatimonadota bacterium]
MFNKKHTLILVPETHWDREWYSTFQEFRIRLVRLTDKLITILDKDAEFKSFTFDGQTIVLEDYLEIRPQEKDRIKKHVQSGRLLIGPWYVLPDEFLVSGEALIRNLMIGHMIGEEFGRTMKAGYIPDPFGHISQLPQILAGFGISNVYFTRGMGDEADDMHSEFWWQAPDGTIILAINQVNSYCNGVNLGIEYIPDKGKTINFDLALQQVKQQIESLSKKASTRYLLLNNGCDHVEPQPELPQIIKYLNEHLEDTEVVHSNYEEYAQLVLNEKPELKTFSGELHRGKYHPLWPGVFSSRMYLKQANERTQTLLEKWTEPACAMAWLTGKPYDSQLLWRAWKYLIQNHPHDSICGCSIDQVHREMMPRFAQAQQIGEFLATESLGYIADKVDTVNQNAGRDSQAVVVFNPHAWEVTDTVTVRVEKEISPGEMPPNYIAKDASGTAVATHVTNDYILDYGRRRAKWSADVHFTGENIPPLGYKTYYLEPGEADIASSLEVGLGYLENEFVKVNVRSNGTFDLFHKQTRTTYHNLNLLEDTEDCGDEYNYGWAYNSSTVTSEGIGGTLSIVERGPGIGVMRCDFVMHLPESLTADRMARTEKTVPCRVIVYIKLHAGLPRVDITTVFENNARDHRLRAHFPTGFSADHCYAEGQFAVIQRSVDLPKGEGWMEKPVAQKSVQSFVAVDGTDCGIAIINQGLPEYELIKGAQCVIAQTLLRCCGWLSRDDFQARPYNAGPTIPTPEAQCLGKHIFRYAVLPYQGNWKRSLVWRQAHQHNAPPRAVVTGIHKGNLPNTLSFAKVSPSNLVVTAVKKAEKCDGLIIRVLNTTPDSVEATISLFRKFKAAFFTNLNEEPIDSKLTATGNSVKFQMPGFRIQTLLFKF